MTIHDSQGEHEPLGSDPHIPVHPATPPPYAAGPPPQPPGAPPPYAPAPPPQRSSSKGCFVIAVLICLGVFALATLMLISSMLSMGGAIDVETGGSGDTVAIVRVEGILTDSESVIEDIKRYTKLSTVKALVVRIDSPGGFVAPSQEIHQALNRVRNKNIPVIASMGTVAASGGYYVALGADKILANPGTATGSIGVILSYPTFGGLFDKAGISMQGVKAGEFKDAGDISRPMTEKEKAMLQERVDEIYDQFIGAVADAREMTKDEVRKVADGRVYSGRQAVAINLIDAEGDLDDAINLAAELAGIKGAPRVLKRKKRGFVAFMESFEESAHAMRTRAMLEQHIPMFLMN